MNIVPKSGIFRAVLVILGLLFAWAVYLEIYWIPFKREVPRQNVQPAHPADTGADSSKEFLSRYEAYEASPTVAGAQVAYLKGFPRTRKGFKALFDQDDFSALYSGSEKYISPLSTLAEKYPSDVEDIVLPIVLDGAPNCCDGWSWLSEIARTLYSDNGKRLGATLKRLPQDSQGVLAHYLTDVENPDYRAEYCRGYVSSMRQQQQKDQMDLFERVCREPVAH